MKNFIIFAFAVVFITSCNNSDGRFAEEIQTVDSLQNKLADLQQKMQGVDTAVVNNKYADFKITHTYLLENYPDSLNRRFWINEMNDLRRIDKAYSRFDAAYRGLMEEIKTTEHKLQTLENSLEDEKLPKEEAEEYIQTESRVIKNIEFTVHKVYPELMTSEQIWDSIGPGVKHIADSIKRLR